jgi:hypothetical protein
MPGRGADYFLEGFAPVTQMIRRLRLGATIGPRNRAEWSLDEIGQGDPL